MLKTKRSWDRLLKEFKQTNKKKLSAMKSPRDSLLKRAQHFCWRRHSFYFGGSLFSTLTCKQGNSAEGVKDNRWSRADQLVRAIMQLFNFMTCSVLSEIAVLQPSPVPQLRFGKQVCTRSQFLVVGFLKACHKIGKRIKPN